jgi:RNase adapter protein RapZ
MNERLRESQLVVVTGMSGAGKSTVLRALDDAGYYCVDNLPPAVIGATVDICVDAGIEKVALGVDGRVGAFLDTAEQAIGSLVGEADSVAVLFLDATDEVLVRRFGETRRPHPLSDVQQDRTLSLHEAVHLERSQLETIREMATTAVDTSQMTVHELRRWVLRALGSRFAERMDVRVMSFGFKHGMPLDANLVFDVRFVENPYFVPGLRKLSGEDDAVRDFVMARDGVDELLGHMQSMFRFLLPRYQQEGKSYLTVAIGCTGGQHRSVALAVYVADWLAELLQRRVSLVHRDMGRGSRVGVADSQQAWGLVRASEPGAARRSQESMGDSEVVRAGDKS